MTFRRKMFARRHNVLGGSLLSAAAVALGLGACSKPAPAPAPQAAPEAAQARVEKPVDLKAWSNQYLADLKADVEGDAAIQAMNANEKVYEAARDQVLTPWREAFATKDAKAFGALLAKDAKVPGFGAAKAELKRDKDGIKESVLKTAAVADASDAEKYLAQFGTIADVRLGVQKVTPTENGAKLEVRYDLRGELASGGRRNDRGLLTVSVVKGEDGKLKLGGVEAASLERVELVGRAPAFEDATKVAGLDKVPGVDRREAIRRGGYAIAVADYDEDGKPDLLLGNWGAIKLYRNVGGTYEDVTAKAGLKADELVKSAAFADMDNDGHKDLVLLRFVPSGPMSTGDFVAYRNKGDGTFEEKGSLLPKSREYDRAMPLTVADLDGNGTLDLYLGFPGSRDFTNDLVNNKRPADLTSQGVWFNEGNWKFKEAEATNTIVAANQTYPHSVVASDLDLDGRPDLIVVDDSGRVNPVYRNAGNGVFKDVTADAKVDAPGWSMGLSTGDFDNDGKLDIITTNVSFLAAQRLVQSVDDKQLSPEMAKRVQMLRDRYVGAQLYHNKGDGTFEEVSAKAGLSDVGDGAGGAEWVDYNADGQLDVMVPNGLWTSGTEEYDSLFSRAMIAKADKYRGSSDVVRGNNFAAHKNNPNPMLTLLREQPQLSLGGHQRYKLFRNNGDGTFTEVAYLENADRTEDGYVVSLADFDGDGKQDMFLRNCDPAPGQKYGSVTLLKNAFAQGHSLTVYARGLQANHDGIGAIVTAYVGKQKFVREIRATNGATQSEPAAFFGLGAATKVDKVTVHWPNGKTQEFGALEAGRVVLQENAEVVRLAAR